MHVRGSFVRASEKRLHSREVSGRCPDFVLWAVFCMHAAPGAPAAVF